MLFNAGIVSLHTSVSYLKYLKININKEYMRRIKVFISLFALCSVEKQKI